MTDIDRNSKRYVRQQLYLTAALCLVGFLAVRIWYLNELQTPLIIASVFTLIISAVFALLWKRIATRQPDQLPTFYTASSGFRMLLALATMFVYYLIVGRDSMLVFVLVFMAFYLISLAHHAAFFARVSNRT